MTFTSLWIQRMSAAALALGIMTAAHAGDSAASRTPAQDVTWMQAPFGPYVAPVEGDFTSGGHVTLVRFAAGMTTPLHTHDHDYTGIVLSGETRHFEPGKPETKTVLGAGSHWAIPAGLEHVSECLPGDDCVMVLIQQDAFDFTPSE